MNRRARRILALSQRYNEHRLQRSHDAMLIAGPSREECMARLSDEEWLIWASLSREAAIEVGVGDHASAVARLVRDEQAGVYGKDRRTA